MNLGDLHHRPSAMSAGDGSHSRMAEPGCGNEQELLTKRRAQQSTCNREHPVELSADVVEAEDT